MSQRWRAGVCIGALVSVLAAGGVAHADVDRATRAAAVALFDEGRKLMTEGKLDQACPKLEKSQSMDPGIGTLYNLSDCYERLGRTASAWLGFREVASEARATQQPAREELARKRVAELEPKLMRLVVTVKAPTPGLSIARDGTPVPEGLWGTPVPLDPGEHVLRASAEGYAPWETKVSVTRAGATITVDVPALVKVVGAPTIVGPTPPVEPARPIETRPDAPPPPPSEGGSWQSPLGLVLAGVGVAGMGVGTVFGFMARSTFDDASGHCDDANKCDQTGVDLRNDAVDQGNLGTIVFVAGGVLAAGGAVLWLTAPSSSDGAATARVGVRPAGVVVEGAF